tara:strand:+ start:2165 stop:2572 length:408 start_codon:yes stop_codon:yes gene_type:complete
MTSFKKRRNKLVKPLVKYLDSTKIQNKSLVAWIRVIHFGSPIMTICSLTYVNKMSSIIILILNFITLSLYLFLGGCFLSKIEKVLSDGDDTNITDIFLEIFDYKITNKNRKHATVIIGIIYFSIIMLIYLFRFHF